MILHDDFALPTWRTRNTACDHCGLGLTQHTDQRWCPRLTQQQLADHLRKNMVGLTIAIESVVHGRLVSAAPQLVIGVTEVPSSRQVWVDFVEGWSVEVNQHGLSIKVAHEVSERDRTLFVECYGKGYYPGLKLNARLEQMLNPNMVIV